MRELRRQLHFDTEISALISHADNWRDAINVALNEMAADSIARSKCPFQIYPAVASGIFQICSVQRFLQQIKRELLAAMGAQCEAAAVRGDAVSGPHFFCDPGGGDLQLGSLVRCPDPKNCADLLDKTGEHGA